MAPKKKVTGLIKLQIKAGDNTQYLRVRQGSLAPVTATCAEVIAGPEGKSYTVKGVVTLLDGQNIYIQDATGGICVRVSAKPTDLKVGDTITVTGVLINYNGKIEFNSGCVLDSFVPAPIPEPVPGSEELPLVWNGAYAVAGTHDVWFTYTATESGIWVITTPEGNYVSGMTFNMVYNFSASIQPRRLTVIQSEHYLFLHLLLVLTG